MVTRASLLVVSIALALATAAACSSSSPSTETCDSEQPCRLATGAGLCSGPVVASGQCQGCPAGYVNVEQCANGDAASDTDAGATCLVEVTCYEVNDAGICGASFLSGPCQPCPAGAAMAGECTLEDGGEAGDGGSDARGD